MYWKKDELAQIIDKAEQLDKTAIEKLDHQSSQGINQSFTWEKIVSEYEKVFKG